MAVLLFAMTGSLVVPVKAILANVTRTRALQVEIGSLRGELRKLGRFGPLVGASGVMGAVYDLIARVAPTDATVCIVGESGTGKEVVAQAVHELSRRRKEPFVPVNCGAVSPNLIESTLFGHEKGSFTGAERMHRGVFEQATGGTLFLDEVSEMPAELQVKLLRVLETGTVMRIGGEKSIAVDVRVIAATNRVPEQALQEGRLREDLWYRLNVFPIGLPPLAENAPEAKTADKPLWEGAFVQPRNTKVFSNFAETRTYTYGGREIDTQVHFGFDLASTKHAPVPAANKGTVVFVGPLTIYGNTVVVDHGWSLMTLYAHLSTIGVKVGDAVEKGQELGRSGDTGLAVGDHLHYEVLVNGISVTPVEWWDAKWIRDRFNGPLKTAGLPVIAGVGETGGGDDTTKAPARARRARRAR